VVERLDVEALTADAQTIERVAERGRIELRGAHDRRVEWRLVVRSCGRHQDFFRSVS
jgi:hypothetical protein